ncbi:MAG TPA: hypothetical protein VFW45_00695, partial [Candidatus Polarisedimenticolia bacterium]|nr:hypothetical protein [Candidatus Polarisedimenticolia bacterium]
MMQWILRTIFIVFALALALQIFPLSSNPPDFRGFAAAALLCGAGFLLETLARRVEIRVLAGAALGAACGAAAGAALWRLVPDAGVLGLGAGAARP